MFILNKSSLNIEGLVRRYRNTTNIDPYHFFKYICAPF